jgi:hypothetical protein
MENTMLRLPRSIAEHIDTLARLTGAPLSFVDQVRELFLAKGISLDTAAGPFLEALEEAFRREERIRANHHRVREQLSKLHDNFKRIGRAYVSQLDQITDSRTKAAAPRRAPAARTTPRATRITIKGDHRTFVTRTEREDLLLVPGPVEPQ